MNYKFLSKSFNNHLHKKCVILFVYLLLQTLECRAQFINQFNQYRNSCYISASHLGKTFNSSIGIARIENIKRLNNFEVIGFLDVLFPLSFNHFNRVAIRKGFQLNLYKKNNFFLPLLFSSTSIHRENFYQNRHDVTFLMELIPTLKLKNLNLSVYYANELIAFSYIKNFKDKKDPNKPQIESHWETPMKYIPKVGVQLNLSLKKFTLYLKSDLERNIYYQVDSKNTSRVFFMNVFGIGYRFQEKK